MKSYKEPSVFVLLRSRLEFTEVFERLFVSKLRVVGELLNFSKVYAVSYLASFNSASCLSDYLIDSREDNWHQRGFGVRF